MIEGFNPKEALHEWLNSTTYCTQSDCPIAGVHTNGRFLDEGISLPRNLNNSPWGSNNPSPEVWAAVATASPRATKPTKQVDMALLEKYHNGHCCQERGLFDEGHCLRHGHCVLDGRPLHAGPACPACPVQEYDCPKHNLPPSFDHSHHQVCKSGNSCLFPDERAPRPSWRSDFIAKPPQAILDAEARLRNDFKSDKDSWKIVDAFCRYHVRCISYEQHM